MKTRIARHVAIYVLIAFTGYGIGACRQNVILNPSEDDLVVLNGCVVSACNYLAAVKTQHKLEENFWAKILLVRYVGHPAGHAYCVWETDGTIYGYDRNAGGLSGRAAGNVAQGNLFDAAQWIQRSGDHCEGNPAACY